MNNISPDADDVLSDEPVSQEFLEFYNAEVDWISVVDRQARKAHDKGFLVGLVVGWILGIVAGFVTK